MILWLLLLTIPEKGKAQQEEALDSAIAVLDTMSLSTLDKAEQFYNIAVLYSTVNVTKGIWCGQKALNLLPKDYPQHRGIIYNTLADLCISSADFEQAGSYADSARIIFEQEDYQGGVAMVLATIGRIQVSLQEWTKALESVNKGMRLSEQIGDRAGVALNLGTLVRIYDVQKEYEQVIKYGKKATAIYESLGAEHERATMNSNIGLAYNKLYQIDSAKYYLSQALQSFEQLKDEQGLAMVYGGLGNLALVEKQYEEALFYLEKAYARRDAIFLKNLKVAPTINLAQLHYQLKNYDLSISYYLNALEDIGKTPYLKTQRKLILEGLVKLHKRANNLTQALSYQDELLLLKDSILDELKIKELKQLEVKYEMGRKEYTNTILKQERDLEKAQAQRNQQIAIGVLMILLLVLIVFFLLFRQNKNQMATKTLQLRHQLLRNQMNPHFIFNSLIAIQSFVFKNEPKKTSKFISSFARLVRAILENSRQEYITIDKEVQWLENYLKLQSLRFQRKFQYNIEIDKAIDLYTTLIPPMLTQPFIENALEHGLKSIDYNGMLSVSFMLKLDSLMVRIEDNGLGLEAASRRNDDKEKHISLASIITKERLDFLNKKKRQKIYFEMKSLPSRGTLVTFSIPLKKK
jgi:tetratricopeptide (TPR) repeat protein